MAYLKKTWREKLHDSKDLPRVVKLTARQAAVWGKGTMAIPSPEEVDAIMKKIPEGKLITINQIREIIAHRHQATIACPITTGIFAWIAAHAATEDEKEGIEDFTPWWRTVKAGGQLNEKYPGGVERQRRLLKREGHPVIQKGKNYFVADLADSLVDIKTLF